MTREEQIKEAARERYPELIGVYGGFQIFVKAAKWADANPLHRTEAFSLMKELLDGITLKYVKSEERLAVAVETLENVKDQNWGPIYSYAKKEINKALTRIDSLKGEK